MRLSTIDSCPRCGHKDVVGVIGRLYRGDITDTGVVFDTSRSSWSEELYEVHCANCGYQFEGEIFYDWSIKKYE